MNRRSKIEFHWTNKNGTKQTITCTGDNFKRYAIQLAEDEQLDKVFNVYYTVDNTITKRLDYYNEELS